MKKSYTKQLKDGPVFRMTKEAIFGGAFELEGKGAGIGEDWESIGLFMKRKYANLLMKAITLEARKK